MIGDEWLLGVLLVTAVPLCGLCCGAVPQQGLCPLTDVRPVPRCRLPHIPAASRQPPPSGPARGSVAAVFLRAPGRPLLALCIWQLHPPAAAALCPALFSRRMAAATTANQFCVDRANLAGCYVGELFCTFTFTCKSPLWHRLAAVCSETCAFAYRRGRSAGTKNMSSCFSSLHRQLNANIVTCWLD